MWVIGTVIVLVAVLAYVLHVRRASGNPWTWRDALVVSLAFVVCVAAASVYDGYGVLSTATLDEAVVVPQTLHESGMLPEPVRIPHESPNYVYAATTWETPLASVIAAVKDGTVLLPNGRVVDGSSKTHHFGKWYWSSTIKAPAGAGAPITSTSPLLTLVQIYGGSFQHVTFDTMPKMPFVCPFLRENPDVRVLVMGTVQQELVTDACPLDSARFVHFDRAIRAPIVYVPYFEGPDLKMGLVPPNSLTSLGPQDAPGTDVFYLPRKAGTVRSVANEALVVSLIKSKFPNLKVYYPVGWRKDRDVLRNAGVIIGPHGGALANILFAPVGATVVEFTPLVRLKRANKNERPCYFGLAIGMGFTYHAVEPSVFRFRPDKNARKGAGNGEMKVPLDRLNAVLKLIPDPSLGGSAPVRATSSPTLEATDSPTLKATASPTTTATRSPTTAAPVKKKPAGEPTWMILLTVNNGFFDFFENWYAHYVRLKMDNRVVVIAEDDETYQGLTSKYPNVEVERSTLASVGALTYDSEDYKAMVSTRADHILRHLKLGEDVVYSDVDIVWLANPFKDFDSKTDFVAQVDNPDCDTKGSKCEGYKPYFCTGLMAMRSNERMIKLIDDWRAALKLTPQLNQPVFNKILKANKVVTRRGLPIGRYPNGQMYFSDMDTKARARVFVVHNNWIAGHDAKLARFKQHKLWLVK